MTQEETMRALFKMISGEGSPDPHAHKCPGCGHIWQHDRADIKTEEQSEVAHTCTRCGLNEDGCYIRYRGPIPISVTESIGVHEP